MNIKYLDDRYVQSVVGLNYPNGNVVELKEFVDGQPDVDVELEVMGVRNVDFINLQYLIPQFLNIRDEDMASKQNIIEAIVLTLVEAGEEFDYINSIDERNTVCENFSFIYNSSGLYLLDIDMKQEQLDEMFYYIYMVSKTLELSSLDVMGGWIEGTMTLCITNICYKWSEG